MRCKNCGSEMIMTFFDECMELYQCECGILCIKNIEVDESAAWYKEYDFEE